MSEADKLFEELGYEVSNDDFVEELNAVVESVVDNGYIKIIFYNNKKLYIDADDIINIEN